MPAVENLAERARLASGPDPAFRLAPHNIEAEQALLGAILVNNDAFDRVSDFLRPDHFPRTCTGASTTRPRSSFAPESSPRRSL